MGLVSPDGSLFAFYHHSRVMMHLNIQTAPLYLQVFDVATGRELWRKTLATGLEWPVLFSQDSRRFCANVSGVITYYDALSGDMIRSFPCFSADAPLVSCSGPMSGFSQVSTDGSYAVLVKGSTRVLTLPLVAWKYGLGTSDELAALDLEGQCVLARLRFDEQQSFRLGERGPVLVTSHRVGDDWFLAAWDLPPRRNWLAIVGIPASGALLLAGLRRGFRRLRAR